MRTRFASAVSAILLATIPLAAPLGAPAAMAAPDPGAWIQVMPVQNRNDTVLSPSRALPKGLNEVDIRFDVPVAGEPHPFTDPNQEIDVTIELSYDGGQTFPDVSTSSFNGMSTWNGTTGGWGRSGNPPIGALGFSPDRYPTNYKAGYSVVNGPVDFGVSVQAS